MRGKRNRIRLKRKPVDKERLVLKTSKDFIELSVIEIGNIIFKHREKEISDEEIVIRSIR